jgi:hypothetical protein
MSRPAVANRLTADPFEQIFGPADEAMAGLELLARSAPLWGKRCEWGELLARLRGFEDKYGPAARTASWSLTDLYGLDPVAPRARLSRMGGAWLACLRNHQVIQVDREAIRLVTRTSARLSIRPPELGGVLAWSLHTEVPAGNDRLR